MSDPAADHPREQDRHEKNDESSADDAVEQAMTDATDNIEDELETILGKNCFDNLRANQTGPLHYTVMSARNGSATTHRVNIQNAGCTCEDMQYNVGDDESRDICAHVAYCLLIHPQLEPESQAFYKYFGLLDEASQRLDEIEDIRDTLEGDLIAARDASAGAAQSQPDPSHSSPDQSGGVDPAEAADTLKAAYDDVIEDMQVQHSEGYVWVQTGKETPEELPGPGSTSVFDALLKDADQVQFVHDDHDLASKKPGEWWKNVIDPEDVDEYINEVLN